MKPIDFIKEDFVTDAADAHQDHEVQMARADCYTAAKYAIELHKLLKHISEQQGLDGWVSEKLTLANDYLRTVHEYLTYEQHSQAMPGFDPQVAEMQIESVVNEGAMESLKAMIDKIKAMPGIQSYIQAANAKKDALIQALQQSQNGQDLVANIQQAVAGDQAVSEDLGQKIGGAVSAVASGGLMVAAADIFMRAYNAMGKPDLTQMMNDPGGKNAVLLVGWLVVLGALGMLTGASIMKKGMRENKDSLHIPDSDKMSDAERHQAIMAKHPDAARVGKTPGRYKTKDGDLVSGIRGVRKLTKEAGYQHGFADPNAPKLGGGRQNDEPDAVNNIEISIDGRAWKVFAGRGSDSSQAFFKQKQSVDDLCKRKSRETGKKWTWGVTGKPVTEGQLELNTPDPVVVIQDLKGKILDKVNLSVAAQKYKLGQPQNIKNQLAHQNYTQIGNYVVVAPMTGQPQDQTTTGQKSTFATNEARLDELGSTTLGSYVNRAVDDVADRSKSVAHGQGFQKGAQFATKAFTGADIPAHTGRTDPKIDKRKAGISKAVGRIKETAGGMGAGSVASSMGSGNGFLNGGPGTISRTKVKKAKK